MSTSARTLFLLGGTGFIGGHVVKEASAAGWRVKGLARSPESSQALAQAGSEPVEAEVHEVDRWAGEALGSEALIDLVQPAFPSRLTDGAVQRLARERQSVTRSVLEGLQGLPSAERPLLFFVSGVDDLEHDANRVVSHNSPVRANPTGLAQIGIPVRALIEQSGVEAVYVYFGCMVYGAGKIYRDVIVRGLHKRRARVLGKGTNRLPLTHVTDAARTLVHIAGLPRVQVAGRTFVAADGAGTTQRDLFDETARGMGIKPPGGVPPVVAGLIAGKAGVEVMVTDMGVDNSALRETGFEFRYPSLREGVPQALEELGERVHDARG